MENTETLSRLPELLLPWYQVHRRDLPWRKDRDPYHIWISEIMLQQTRVEAVKGYYTRFLSCLPSVSELACCDDEVLHKLWEGLGYYSRVRNLKKAAQVIMADFNGRFPRTYQEVIGLPGIGPYTAGAVCSIAYDLPTPAVDGNVLRLLSRLCRDPRPIDLPQVKKEYTEILEQIYPREAGSFTQALMELGATICGPNRAPDCKNCPVCALCAGRKAGIAEELPHKLPKKERRKEEKTVFILCCEGCYALQKRSDKGLLASLWQFPNVEGHLTPQQALNQAEAWETHPKELQKQVNRSHIFTHIEWNMQGFYIETAAKSPAFHWFTAEEMKSQAALPTAFRQFIPENPENF